MLIFGQGYSTPLRIQQQYYLVLTASMSCLLQLLVHVVYNGLDQDSTAIENELQMQLVNKLFTATSLLGK